MRLCECIAVKDDIALVASLPGLNTSCSKSHMRYASQMHVHGRSGHAELTCHKSGRRAKRPCPALSHSACVRKPQEAVCTPRHLPRLCHSQGPDCRLRHRSRPATKHCASAHAAVRQHSCPMTCGSCTKVPCTALAHVHSTTHIAAPNSCRASCCSTSLDGRQQQFANLRPLFCVQQASVAASPPGQRKCRALWQSLHDTCHDVFILAVTPPHLPYWLSCGAERPAWQLPCA